MIPGVGAQGGNLKDVVRNGINSNCGLIVNSSRGIIYASQGNEFSQKAAEKASLRVDIKAPTPETPSMTMAIEKYIENV